MRGWDLITRRKLIASGSSSGLALVVAANGGSLFAASKEKAKGGDHTADYLRSFGPIDRTLGEVAPRQFFGVNAGIAGIV